MVIAQPFPTPRVESNEPEKPTVLLLEDDSMLADLFERSLLRRGCRVTRFSSAEDVDAATEAGLPGVLVSDLWLTGSMNGLELVERLRARRDQRPVLLISGAPDRSMEEAALAAGAFGFLPKPFSLEELGLTVEGMLASQDVDSRPVPSLAPTGPR